MIPFVLIDDDVGIRTLVRTAAELSGFVDYVGEADDGESGLALIRSTRAHVAVVDLDLPDIRGDRIAELLCDEGLDCKVILHTGHDVDQLPRGVVDSVLKDGDIDALLAAVGRAASGHRATEMY